MHPSKPCVVNPGTESEQVGSLSCLWLTKEPEEGLAPTRRLFISPVFCPVFQVSHDPFGRQELPRLLCGDKWNELISICKQVWGSDTGGTHSLEINTGLGPQSWAKLLLEHQAQKHLFLNLFSCMVDVPRVTRSSENHRPAQRTPKSSRGFMHFFHSNKFMSTYCIPVPILGTERRVMSKTKKNFCSSSSCEAEWETDIGMCLAACRSLEPPLFLDIFFRFTLERVWESLKAWIWISHFTMEKT